MKKVLFTITIILLVAAFVASGFMIVNYLIEGKEQEQKYDDLANIKNQAQATATTEAPAPTTEGAETTEPKGTTEPTEPGMLPGYKELYEMNNDMVGWLKIDGTKLDYPVMQHKEGADENGHDFYLYRDFDKKDSKRGAVFVKENVDVEEPSDNIVLYGHNMADGSMFAALNAYTNKQTWENNSLIFFDTLTENHVYKIFAVFKTSANLGQGFTYHKFVDAEDEADFNQFVAKCKELSFYDTGITPKYGDKLIMLSTCEYTLDNGRLVVAAYRIS